jgi:hypothetical protein
MAATAHHNAQTSTSHLLPYPLTQQEQFLEMKKLLNILDARSVHRSINVQNGGSCRFGISSIEGDVQAIERA